MTGTVYKGRALIGGKAVGESVVSSKAFTFAHGVDPRTGEVTDIRSDIKDSVVKGKVLFYPFGKGSTTASSWFLETVRSGNAPSAIVTRGVDLSAVIGSVIAKIVYNKVIPVLSSFPDEMYGKLRSGERVDVDGDKGEVTLH